MDLSSIFEKEAEACKSTNSIVLSFNGELDHHKVITFSLALESSLDDRGEGAGNTKRLMNICVEALQNVIRYGKEEENNQAFIIICDKPEEYTVQVGNIVKKQDCDKLENRVKTIMGMSLKEVKNNYKSILQKGVYTNAGTGGLGLLTIAINSKGGINYQAHYDSNSESSIFVLKLRLTKA